MLTIKTEVRPSPLHGLGLFAAEAVRAGQVVWRFTPGFDLDCDPAELDRLSEPQRERLLHYGYVDDLLNRYVLCCDDYRFVNHSHTPNVASDRSTDRHGIDAALRAIAAGEEITIDYRSFEKRS